MSPFLLSFQMKFPFVIAIVLICWSGCAHVAQVTTLQPATVDVSGMSRVAVMDFSGEHGSAVATNLSGRLWENQFYTVVDRSEIRSPVQQASFQNGSSQLSQVLSPARDAGVDGVILGEVVEYRCDDEVLQSTSVNFHKDDVKHNDHDHDHTGFGVDHQETLLREGTVTIAFRLVDVSTGEVRASKQVSKHYEGRSINGDDQLPPKGEVLDQLTQQCLDEIIAMLAPHETTCEIELATCDIWTRGRSDVKAGVGFAKKGEWEKAEARWQSAVDSNPENHAALFNLSVAAMQKQNYAEAEDLAMKAVRIEHKCCYANGLEVIRERRMLSEKAQQQKVASGSDGKVLQ